MKKISAVFISILTLAAVVFIGGCAQSNELILSGVVEATQYDVSTQAPGMVSKVLVEDGLAVQTGDVIAELDSAMQEAALHQAQAAVKARQARLDEVKSGSRSEQIATAEAAVAVASAKLNDLTKGATSDQIHQSQAAEKLAATNQNNARIAWEYAQKKYDDAQELFDQGRMTQSALDDVKLKLDTAKGAYDAAADQHEIAVAQLSQVKRGATSDAKKAAQAAVDQAVAQLDLVKNGATTYSVTAAEAELESAVAQQEQAEITASRCIVKAPVAGILTAVGISVGDMVNSGTIVATIIDASDLWVRVYVPQAYLQKVSLGQEIGLRCPAYPDKTFTGKIVFVASQAEFTPKNIQTDADKANTVFRLKITIEDGEALLKPGMTMNAVLFLK